eukprot:1696541-Amphidinium_carterae.1
MKVRLHATLFAGRALESASSGDAALPKRAWYAACTLRAISCRSAPQSHRRDKIKNSLFIFTPPHLATAQLLKAAAPGTTHTMP